MTLARDQLLDLLHSKLQNSNLRRHSYAVEAAMRALARYFKANEDLWGAVGLLHDGDYEETKDDMEKHSVLMAQWVADLGETDQELLAGVKSHGASHLGKTPQNELEKSLFCCDELTGLIVATALMTPGKKLAEVDVETVLKKFNKPKFAAGAKREDIQACENLLNIPLHEFVQIVLDGMKTIDKELGL